MPYIKPEERVPYQDAINELAELVKAYGEEKAASYAGQLNYIITSLLLRTYKEGLPNYTDFNEMIGILECAKQELYRRAAAPYEDKKIKENGDV